MLKSILNTIFNEKKLLLGIFIFNTLSFISYNLNAQNNKVDSLLNELKNAKEDTNKVNILNDLCWENKSINPGEAIEYGKKGLQLAQNLNFSKGIANSLFNLGVISKNQGNYEQSINYYSKSLEIYRNLNDKKKIAQNLNGFGLVYLHQTRFEKALSYFKESLRIREECGDEADIASSLNNIGLLYLEKDNYSKALDYFLKAINIREKINDKINLAGSYNNVGGIYYYQSNNEQALSYFEKSLKIFSEINNKQEMATDLSNIGGIYYVKKEYDKALDFYKQALNLRRELKDRRGVARSLQLIGIIYENAKDFKNADDYYNQAFIIVEELDDKKEIAQVLNNIGSLQLAMGNYQKALDAINKSIKISLETGANVPLKNAYGLLCNVYEAIGNIPEAYTNYKLYIQVKDSIFNETSQKQITEMQTKYETEKKEQEIVILTKDKSLKESELKRQKMLMSFIIVIVLLVIFLLIMMFRSYREKIKDNILLRNMNSEIIQQKDEIVTQSEHILIINKALEKKNFQITDSIDYAKRIQDAILPSDKLLKKYCKDFFIFFSPRDIVSGDFYWVNEHNGKLLVAVVDCTGHGVPGALMSMIGYTLLNEIVKRNQSNTPAEMLEELNRNVVQALNSGNVEEDTQTDGMDITICMIDKENNELQFACANQEFVLLQGDAENIVKGDMISIGNVLIKDINQNFTNHSYSLSDDSVVYMFSDGYQDQFGGPNNRKFMLSKFETLLSGMRTLPADNQKAIIENTFNDWKGDNKQIDDVLVIGLRI